MKIRYIVWDSNSLRVTDRFGYIALHKELWQDPNIILKIIDISKQSLSSISKQLFDANSIVIISSQYQLINLFSHFKSLLFDGVELIVQVNMYFLLEQLIIKASLSKNIFYNYDLILLPSLRDYVLFETYFSNLYAQILPLVTKEDSSAVVGEVDKVHFACLCTADNLEYVLSIMYALDLFYIHNNKDFILHCLIDIDSGDDQFIIKNSIEEFSMTSSIVFHKNFQRTGINDFLRNNRLIYISQHVLHSRCDTYILSALTAENQVVITDFGEAAEYRENFPHQVNLVPIKIINDKIQCSVIDLYRVIRKSVENFYCQKSQPNYSYFDFATNKLKLKDYIENIGSNKDLSNPLFSFRATDYREHYGAKINDINYEEIVEIFVYPNISFSEDYITISTPTCSKFIDNNCINVDVSVGAYCIRTNCKLGNVILENAKMLLQNGHAEMKFKSKFHQIFAEHCLTSMSILKNRILNYGLQENETYFVDILKNLGDSNFTDICNIVWFGDFFKYFFSQPLLYNKDYKFWVLSSAVKRVLVNLYNMPNNYINVLPRYELFPPKNIDRNFDIKTSDWVYAGRLSSVKNIDLLIYVFNLWQKTVNPQARFFLLGEFDNDTGDYTTKLTHDYSEQIYTLCQDLTWKTPPIFLGKYQADKWVELLNTRMIMINLSTSLKDDFGVAIAQAQEKAIPVIVSNWGGSCDITGGAIKVPYSLVSTRNISYQFSANAIVKYILNHADDLFKKHKRKKTEEINVTSAKKYYKLKDDFFINNSMEWLLLLKDFSYEFQLTNTGREALKRYRNFFSY